SSPPGGHGGPPLQYEPPFPSPWEFAVMRWKEAQKAERYAKPKLALSLPRTPKVRMRTVKLHSKTTLLSSVLIVAMLIAALAVTSAAIANIERTDDQTLAETQ